MTWGNRAWWAVVWRERWHVAVLLLATLPLLSRLGGAPGHGEAWQAERREVVKQLERTAVTIDRQVLQDRLNARPSLRWRVGAFAWAGIMAFGIGCLALWRTIRRVCRGEAAFPRGPSPPSAPWGLWDLVKLFAWLIWMAQVITIVHAVVMHAFQLEGMDRHLAATVNTVLLDGLAILLVTVLILRRHRVSARLLGLRGDHLRQQVAIGLWGYVLWVPLFAATVAAVMGIVQWLRLEPMPQAVVAMLLQESRPRLLLLLMGVVAVLGPVAEEIVFRGVAYPALRRRWGIRWGVSGSAALFAAMHADPVAFGPVFVLGVLLCWLYEQTGSLIPSMTVHIVHNSVMLVAAMTVRDLLHLLGGPG